MRCAKCGLPHSRLSRDKRAGAPLRWLSLGRRRRTRARDVRAVRCAVFLVDPCTMESHCTSGRPLPLGARPWCDVPSAASRTAGFRVTNARARHCAGYLLGGGAPRALATSARRAAMVVVGPCAIEGHYTSGWPLLFHILRCKTVLRRACCGLYFTQPTFVRPARACTIVPRETLRSRVRGARCLRSWRPSD